MDFLWFLDAPFWQKLYFIGMVAGVATFISLIQDTLYENRDAWKKIKENFKKAIEEQKIELERWKQ